jgi:hypothetical protein
MAVSVGLLLLGSMADVLTGNAFLTAAFVLPAPFLLAFAVYGRSRVRKLPWVAVAVAFYCMFSIGAFMQQTLLIIAGHEEICRYLSSFVTPGTARSYTTTTWVVQCPDGRQTFFTASTDPQFYGPKALISMRTVAGGLLGADSSARVANYADWFGNMAGVVGTAAVLTIALVTPRSEDATELADRVIGARKKPSGA